MSEPFSASRAARFMACPASAHLELAIPNWEPPTVDPMAGAKGKGTLMHQMLEPLWGLTRNDLKRVAAAVQYVSDLRQKRKFNAWVEHTRQATWLDSEPWTTADLVLFTRDEIHVVDFKWGRIPVDVAGNEQLLYYLATYIDLAPKAKFGTVHIVQPYADTFEAWEVDGQTLTDFVLDAQMADRKINAGVKDFGPSDNCTFCPANPHSRGDKGKPLCPAMMNLLYPKQLDEDAMLDMAD